jgi:molybdopterin/thiamine biosynthesis adenylyltransferase/proteasome lid subunit RPN8/RPN11
MRYSITFLEEQHQALTGLLFPAATERAAYLLCGLSVGTAETKLLVREVVPVGPHEIASASRTQLSIPAISYVKWLKRADESTNCLVFVHSHPEGMNQFSDQDDREEAAFFRTAHVRVHGRAVHGSLIFSSPTAVVGRAWLEDGTARPLDCIRIIGQRFRMILSADVADSALGFFDRQVRAFGQGFQPVLHALRVGIVGVGGTGSSVAEQLIRLGVGHLTVIDGGRFEVSNINRVYGSRATDDGVNKTQIVERAGQVIGLGTTVTCINRPITFRSAMMVLKDCDVVFGCTDDQWGRSLLTTFALQYLTPVIDLGVAIDSTSGIVERVEARVTTLLPGAACLYCRNRISPQGIRAESLQELDPTQAEQLRREGYLLGIQETAPSVVTFTTAIAAAAVTELLHRLTGFMGTARTSTEVIHRFDWSRVRTNNVTPRLDCQCADRSTWGIGDTRPFLGVTWRPES